MKPQKSFSNNEHVQHEILFLGSNPKLSFCVCKWSIPYFVGKKKTALLTKSKTFLEVFGVSLDSQANKSQLNAESRNKPIRNKKESSEEQPKANQKQAIFWRFDSHLYFFLSFIQKKLFHTRTSPTPKQHFSQGKLELSYRLGITRYSVISLFTLKVGGGQLESLCYFDHHTHFIICPVIIFSCNHLL